MCNACWEGYGTPSELPPEAPVILDLIKELYEQPDAISGGPLHVEIDDFNIDLDWNPDKYPPVEPWAPRTLQLSREIGALMQPLSLEHRAAIVAVHWGYLDPEGI